MRNALSDRLRLTQRRQIINKSTGGHGNKICPPRIEGADKTVSFLSSHSERHEIDQDYRNLSANGLEEPTSQTNEKGQDRRAGPLPSLLSDATFCSLVDHFAASPHSGKGSCRRVDLQIRVVRNIYYDVKRKNGNQDWPITSAPEKYSRFVYLQHCSHPCLA